VRGVCRDMAQSATPASTIRNDGVLAVLVTTSADTAHVNADVVGSEGPDDLLALCSWAETGLDIGALTSEDSLRVLVGERAISVTSSPFGRVTMVLVKGHPIVKSAKRLARQLMRNMIRSEHRAIYRPKRIATTAPAPASTAGSL